MVITRYRFRFRFRFIRPKENHLRFYRRVLEYNKKHYNLTTSTHDYLYNIDSSDSIKNKTRKNLEHLHGFAMVDWSIVYNGELICSCSLYFGSSGAVYAKVVEVTQANGDQVNGIQIVFR